MKPLSKRQQWAVLRALIRNWGGAVGRWRCARLLLGRKVVFTDARLCEAVGWFVVFNGAWGQVREHLLSVPQWGREFVTWGDKVKGWCMPKGGAV